jgi:ferrous iron transport protein B
LSKPALHIALVGNPNSGKTSLFNALTGLNQKVGNFPGVTVDKKTGHVKLEEGLQAALIDLPGTYSLYPRRSDEWVAYKVLMGADADVQPDIVLLVADASNLKRNLLFCSQIIDLKIPVVMALTMNDIAAKKDIKIDISGLEAELGIPVVAVNPRKNKGLGDLKKVLSHVAKMNPNLHARDFMATKKLAGPAIDAVQKLFPKLSDYAAVHYLINHEHFPLDALSQKAIGQIEAVNAFNPTKTQAEEIMQRYTRIRHIMQLARGRDGTRWKGSLFTDRLDDLLLRPHLGAISYYSLYFFFCFKACFWIAQFPMDGIEWLFGAGRAAWCTTVLPAAWWSDLIVNGFLAGLSGIFVFVPQIMILFGLITILEDTGYMARISFLSG